MASGNRRRTTIPPDAPDATLEHDALTGETQLVPPSMFVTPEPGQVLIRKFRLVVLEGPDAGQEFSSQSTRTVIGTHPSCDLVLHDRTVSRFHATLSLEQGNAMIQDLDSKNGTVVGGVRVKLAYLRTGVTVILGATKLRFDLGDDHAQVPLSARDRYGLMVGRSTAMRAVFAVLERAAETDSTVLIEGETGTGKEIAAESIHMESARKDGPFLVIDCSAIPPDLLASELFGHERGAFTGAVAARQGAFASAIGGTVFLDEIGELPSDLQPKVLRVLERREVKRVGQATWSKVDVRVIAATNRDLRAEVNAQRFRSDLYYRLAVLQVRLPALKEHLDDLPLLVDDILERLGAQGHPEADVVRSPHFLDEISRHGWPGNVRELRNYIERCLAFRHEVPHLETGPVEGGDPGAANAALIDVGKTLKAARDRWNEILELRYLQELLARHGDNVTAAARAAGVGRVHLYRLLWKHGLR